MTEKIRRRLFSFDLVILGSVFPLLFGGLSTMYSFGGEESFFERQLIWIGVSFVIFILLSLLDFRFLRKSVPVMIIYFSSIILLGSVFIFGSTINASKSWIKLGAFSLQPADFAKIALIILLAKYFSKRHVEIANIKHIIVSGIYAFIPFALILAQPDLGSAIIIFLIWFGMVLISGISKKHLLAVFLIGLVSFGLMWQFAFKDYQKKRIINFVSPLSDIRGSGYNAYQSIIAVGSGEVFGKGIGFGTQSRLNFLPEYETDFIFAAFAEEWGLIGVIFIMIAYTVLVLRIISNAEKGETNFEILFCVGFVILLMGHFLINVGMNIGLMPVTGIPLPFVSYGGSHLLASFIGIGIISSMKKYERGAHKDLMKNEFLGI